MALDFKLTMAIFFREANGLYTCPGCQETQNTRADFLEHIQEVHHEMYIHYQNEYRNGSLGLLADINSRYVFHIQVLPLQLVQEFQCPECEVHSAEAAVVADHIRDAHPDTYEVFYQQFLAQGEAEQEG